jgi:A/G-specific adenine glycosylase
VSAAALLAWYRATRRDLPWRRTRDPWAIWVSEVMLQQTRVEHVVAYYEPFLARYPTPAALAEAPLEEALACWSGLGYYRRLRLLHRAASLIVAAGGEVPSEEAALRALPGVGDYTAAAVASIAFGSRVPVLDGNVVRVLCRYLACGDDPARAPVRRRLREAAAELLDAAAAGDSNQALMELGARVCMPREARCHECPLAASCVARAQGMPLAYPRLAARRPPQRVALVVLLVEHEARILLFRRGDDAALLAGTWELPWVEAGAEPERRLAARYGIGFAVGERVGTVRHTITTRRLQASVHRARLATTASEVGEGREAGWFAGRELGSLPVSSLVHKALALAPPG